MIEEGKEDIKSEAENLNWWKEVKTYSLEEVETIKKEMQSNSEKGVQKILNEQKAYKKAMSSLWDISEDQNKLIDLFSENEEAGQIILDTYYNWQSIEDFKESIDYKVDKNSPEQIRKQITKELLDIKNKEISDNLNIEVNTKKDKFIKDLKLSWDELKEFNDEFEDRRGLKSFSIKNLDKHLSSAYRETKPEWISKAELNEKLAKSISNTSWKGASKSKTIKQTNSDFNKKFLKERGIL